ncbi:MAG: hypothetical protein IBJ07_08855 [Rhizobiaceae bacterium]|nr:hypothetical protein [Rhizobiaceae bacterium]
MELTRYTSEVTPQIDEGVAKVTLTLTYTDGKEGSLSVHPAVKLVVFVKADGAAMIETIERDALAGARRILESSLASLDVEDGASLRRRIADTNSAQSARSLERMRDEAGRALEEAMQASRPAD